jgi:hypothetical protein
MLALGDDGFPNALTSSRRLQAPPISPEYPNTSGKWRVFTYFFCIVLYRVASWLLTWRILRVFGGGCRRVCMRPGASKPALPQQRRCAEGHPRAVGQQNTVFVLDGPEICQNERILAR